METREQSFARSWADAWSSRNLEALVGLFSPGGCYEDLTFDSRASGKDELRKLFSRIFHGPAARFSLDRIFFDPAGVADLRWTRSARPGSAKIQFQGGLVQVCQETWDPPKPSPRITFADDHVVLGGVRVKIRRTDER